MKFYCNINIVSHGAFGLVLVCDINTYNCLSFESEPIYL